MLRSQDPYYIAKSKVEEIENRRMKQMKKQPPYKVFNGWWSIPDGVSVVSLACLKRILCRQVKSLGEESP